MFHTIRALLWLTCIFVLFYFATCFARACLCVCVYLYDVFSCQPNPFDGKRWLRVCESRAIFRVHVHAAFVVSRFFFHICRKHTNFRVNGSYAFLFCSLICFSKGKCQMKVVHRHTHTHTNSPSEFFVFWLEFLSILSTNAEARNRIHFCGLVSSLSQFGHIMLKSNEKFPCGYSSEKSTQV